MLDPGTTWTRAGFAGEDTPKAVVPSDYGVSADGKFYFGDNDVHTVRPGVEIKNPMKDGVGTFKILYRSSAQSNSDNGSWGEQSRIGMQHLIYGDTQ